MYTRTTYDETAKAKNLNIQKLCSKLEKKIDALAPSREKSIALTKLDEVAMWAGSAIAADQQARKAEEKEKLLADIMTEADKHIGETSPVEEEEVPEGAVAKVVLDGELVGYLCKDDTPKSAAPEFEVGDKVMFRNADKHQKEPYFYPEVGTVGKVIRKSSEAPLELLVCWPRGATSDDDHWWCYPEDVILQARQTYYDKLKEVVLDADLRVKVADNFCPRIVGGPESGGPKCGYDCTDCWNTLIGE